MLSKLSNRSKMMMAFGSVAGAGMLSVACPAATSHAAPIWKPPMPCVAVGAGAFPPGAGVCPASSGGLDWGRIGRWLAASDLARQSGRP
jgi:hypothetical protein